MNRHEIKDIKSRYIIDSRGNPTIEVDIYLQNGIFGRASVPSGASTGDKEALELRDQDLMWVGKGVNTAIDNIEKYIKPNIVGQSCLDIQSIDRQMLELDGTNNKSKIGANAILAVSLANVQAGANYKNSSLFNYINPHCNKMTLPIPMMNILNGGSHADNNVGIQEFMIMPIDFPNYSEALRSGVEIFHSLKSTLKKKGYNTSIGDEGGFAPNLNSNEEALELILNAIENAGYHSGKNIFLALDVAASEFYCKDKNAYNLESNNQYLSSLELIDYYKNLCNDYPIISIEDGLDQNDWPAWQSLTASLGDKIQIVGDDLTVTNPKFLKQAIDLNAMNAILIKLNQIGSFTETMETIILAKNNNFNTIISHRSGETENTFIADLAVACDAGQIKTGSLCRTDRTAKYNQLLRIEEELGTKAIYANKQYII